MDKERFKWTVDCTPRVRANDRQQTPEMERMGKFRIIYRSELVRDYLDGDEEKFKYLFLRGFIPPANIAPQKGEKGSEAGWRERDLWALRRQLILWDSKTKIIKYLDAIIRLLKESRELKGDLEIAEYLNEIVGNEETEKAMQLIRKRRDPR